MMENFKRTTALDEVKETEQGSTFDVHSSLFKKKKG